ncbi:MAG TPA: DoxX family protein [Gemmatimonadales bacterium]|nr:DoxX family protein [Gemmatimonadales bacterium]
MTEQFDRQWRSLAHSALRIAAGLAYFSHGAQKLLGWFGGFGPGGGSAELMSRFGIAGTIETVGGALLIMGLFTRPVAFITSGEMAVTYFWMHWGGSGQVFWWQNHGETPLLYCFIWFLFAAWGPGAFSLDAWIRKQPTPSGG